MPVRRCQEKKKSGLKYGKSGKCYTGPGARQRAELQGIAIRIAKKRAKKNNKKSSKK